MIRRSLWLASVASVLLFHVVPAEASMQYRVDDGALAPLSAPVKLGGKVKISRVPLVDGEESTLELERFEVWADNAEIKVFGANEEVLEMLPRPDAKYYRGRVAGKPDSLVFIAVTGRRIDGLVYTDDRKFALGSERKTRGSNEFNLVVQESSVLDDIPEDGQGFQCGVEKIQVNNALRPRAVTNALGEPVSNVAPTGTQRSVINLAVDTDYELFDKAGDTSQNVTTYIGNLMAAVSTIYERDLKTEIRIAYLGIQSNVADPFSIVPGSNGTSFDALVELGNRWHLTPPTATPRSAATLVSGKNQLAGIAWVGTLCTNDFLYQAGPDQWGGKYSFNGGITPPANLSVPDPDANANYVAPSSNYWPLLQVSHELGHNVGSDHTHCISLTPAQKTEYGVSRSFVDECYNGESGNGCFGGTQLVPAEKGSIMSYCHLRSPGFGTNTRFTFGQDGETSEVALNGLIADMASKTPGMSSITSPLSLVVGETGIASVTNVAGLTYSWTISNGTFTGGGTTASGNSVSFSGTVDPVTLTVTATNSQTCSVTDSKTVAIEEDEQVTPEPPINVIATATGATSVEVSWAASAGATEYDVWRSASGSSFSLVGSAGANTTFTDNTATANTSYRYVVRAGAGINFSVFSDDDVATTVVFTDPTLSGTTKVKLTHFTQLLTAVNAMRTLAGLSTISLSAPAPATNVTLRRQHILDLRTALDAARGVIGLPALTYTDSTITAGSTKVKAAHVNELRAGVM